jgi:hypothetical protein
MRKLGPFGQFPSGIPKRSLAILVAAAAIGGLTGYLGPFALLWATLGASENKVSAIWLLLVPAIIWAFVYCGCLGFERLGPPYVNFPLAMIAGAYLGPIFLIILGSMTGSFADLDLAGLLVATPVLIVVPLVLTWPSLVYLSRAPIEFETLEEGKPTRRKSGPISLFGDGGGEG